MNRWYRAYEGTIADPKLAEAALAAGVKRSLVIAAWHGILESAAAADDDGRYETGPRRLAAVLCEEVEALQAVFAAFTEIGLIADGRVAAWGRRQYQGDNSSERVRRYRAARQTAPEPNNETACNGDETLQPVSETLQPVSETQRNVSETRCNAPETETETETELISSDIAADAAMSAERPPAKARGDPRQELFARGRLILQRMTGRTEASCRALIGRWLRDLDDEAVHVLAAIEEAERSGPLADPTAWINSRLKPYRRQRNGKDRSISAAAGELADAAQRGEFGFGPRPRLVHPAPGEADVRLLSAQRKL